MFKKLTLFTRGWPPVNIIVKSVRCWNLLFDLASKWSKSATWFVTRPKLVFKSRLFQGRFPQKEVVSFVYIRSSSHRVDLKRFVPFKVVRKDVEKVKDLHIAAGWRKDPL